MSSYRILLTLAICLLAVSVHAQIDSTQVTADSLSAPKKRGQLEGKITYEARDIYTDVINRKTIFIGDARVKYTNISLKAEQITVDWKNDLMLAQGLPDTVITVNEQGDSVQTVMMKGLPEFVEGGDVIRGESMTYNFNTRKARVLRGRTQFEDGYYDGRAIKMVDKKTLNIGNASYTTCDKEENPHFHFGFKQTKVIVNERLIAKPVIFYMGKIPIMALPFAYFPINKGRHSGFLLPKYGSSTSSGRYLRGMGYYWAPSDYWDLKSTIDYFEDAGFLFRSDMRYKVRYKMTGSISGSFTKKDFEASGTKQRRWDLKIRHSQDISPTMKLTASGYLVSSGSFLKELSSNREQRMRQQITSNATLTKRFGGSNSMTVNLSQTRDLSTDNVTETLPRVSFRLGQRTLIPQPKPDREGKVNLKWYHNIYMNYSSQILSKRTRTQQTTAIDTFYNEDRDMGWDHTMSISSPQKILGVLTFNPSMNYNETWYGQRQNYYFDEDNEIQSEEEDGFFALRSFSTSAGLSTKLYGMFQPRKDILLRHVMTPSVSFSFAPDFTGDEFGYYQYLKDSTGTVYEKDRFASNIFRSTPGGESQSMRFSVNNVFQMKKGEDEEIKKIDLFTWNLSSNYNWKAEEKKLGNITSSLRAKPFKTISLNLGSTFSPYKTDENGSETNELMANDFDWNSPLDIFGMRLMRMTRLNSNISFSFSGHAKSDSQQDSSQVQEKDERLKNLDPITGDRFDLDDDISSLDIPWKLSGSLNYSENRNNPQNTSKTFWIRSALEFNLTKNWKISYRAQFDMMAKRPVSQDFTFYRDLHCWEARFSWSPTGYQRFSMKINIKSNVLQDIKYERRTGNRGLYGY